MRRIEEETDCLSVEALAFKVGLTKAPSELNLGSLSLRFKVGESALIGEDIVVKILASNRGTVRLHFMVPKEISIVRME